VVITGSKQGITNPPGNPAYNASKSAVKTLAEHLSFDLRNEPSIAVHLLVPGWTFTGLGGNRPGSGREKPDGAWWPDQVVDYLERKMAEGKFYILCPDGDVTEKTDKKRMLWSVGDVVEGRPPLTRWRDEWKGAAKEWMDKKEV
jgi:NAD(P)-dependent dehydrogenase (short-subunit alcohol dehydrogenase family)